MFARERVCSALMSMRLAVAVAVAVEGVVIKAAKQMGAAASAGKSATL